MRNAGGIRKDIPIPASEAGAGGQPALSSSLDPHLVSLIDPMSFPAEQYRALRLMLEQLLSSNMVIAVTSPVGNDGKTTTAINVAAALAYASGARVLIVDLDLRAPSIATRLGMRADDPDLLAALLDPNIPLASAIREHPQFSLHVLAPGRTLTMPYDLLKSARLADLIREARQEFTCIVLDTPPLIPVPDARLIENLVDGILLVVGAHRTPRRLLAETLNLVDRAKLLGIVFNGDRRPLSGYYDAYGYGAYRGRRRHIT